MRRTTVLVDASILKPHLGGIRTYALSVLRALAEVHDLELHVATSLPEELAGVDVAVLPVPARTRDFGARAVWREASLPGLVRATGAELVLVPFPEHAARPLGVPSVMVVYDVGPLVAPAYFSRAKRLRFAVDLPRACRAATRVVCVSNATLAALHAATGTDPRKCRVIGGGPSPAARVRLPEVVPGGRPYVLYVGTLLPHKNVPTLVAAFAEPGGLPFDLVLVGPRTDAEAVAFDALVGRLGLEHQVRHLGWVADEVLTDLYTGAVAVTVPSMHEGYGLPALEAMALGAPVVASDIPAIREIGGHAVAYVGQPLRPAAWQRALEDVGTRPDLGAALAERGRQEAMRHTWEGAGDAYLSLIDELIA